MLNHLLAITNQEMIDQLVGIPKATEIASVVPDVNSYRVVQLQQTTKRQTFVDAQRVPGLYVQFTIWYVKETERNKVFAHFNRWCTRVLPEFSLELFQCHFLPLLTLLCRFSCGSWLPNRVASVLTLSVRA